MLIRSRHWRNWDKARRGGEAAPNPLTWARRLKWEKTYGMKQLYNIQNSMDAAAVLIVAVLKQEGEISKEQKQCVLKLFEDEFDITASDASELLVSSPLVRDYF